MEKFIKNLQNIIKSYLSKPSSKIVLISIIIFLAFLAGYNFKNKPTKYAASTASEHTHTNEADWWTCSMHPQIKLPEPGKCPICFMDLIPLKTNADDDHPRQLQMSEAARLLAEIQTSTIKRNPAHKELRLSGKITYDETRVKTLTAWMSGRLERLYVDYAGMPVKNGEHLVDIYSPELFSAQEELLQAKLTIERRTNQSSTVISNSRNNLEAARDKLRLLGLSDIQIQAIEKQRKASEIMTIYSPLSGIVTHKHAVEGMYVKTGMEIYTIADLDQIWVILDAYESDLAWLHYGQDVNIFIEAIHNQEFNGKIAFIDPILDPATRTVKVRINLPNKSKQLKPGMFVRAVVHSQLDALGNIINTELAGKWISPMHPEIVKDRPGTCDICGMPLIRTEELRIVKKAANTQLPLLVPASAVLKTGKRALVYVKVPGTEVPTYESREIQISTRTGDYYIVIKGLSEGEEVVTNGNFKIDSAMQLSSKPSMMNSKGGVSSTGHEGHGGAVATSTTPVIVQVVTTNVPMKFREALTPLYDSYLNAQMALAEENYKQSKKHLTKLGKLVDKFNVVDFILSDVARYQFLQLNKQITYQTQHTKHWGSIREVRKAFENISIAVLNMEKQFGHSGQDTFYESFCPMAFDNKGASWLANDKQINNPFFGVKMLRCGEVKATFTLKMDLMTEHNGHE